MPTTYAAGAYGFNRDWTRSNISVDDGTSGNGVATLLLGYPSTAAAQLNASPFFSWHYGAVYLQDDYQVSRRLTVNVGLRWDVETPPVERYNRQNRGFAFGVPSPLQVPGLTLTGGLLYAGAGGQPRGAYDTDWYNFGPRLGLAYRVLDSKRLVFAAASAGSSCRRVISAEPRDLPSRLRRKSPARSGSPM